MWISIDAKKSFILVFAIILSGCSTLTPTVIKQFDERTPIKLISGSHLLEVKKLVFKMPGTQETGTAYAGLACVPRHKLHGISKAIDIDEYVEILKKELTKANYNLVADPKSLFEDPKESKAEYQLAGKLKHVAMNICYPSADLSKTSGEASMEFEWQLYHRQTKSVVYNRAIGGTAKTDTGPRMGYQAALDAFAISVRSLLADEQFVKFLSRTPIKSAPSPKPVDSASKSLTIEDQLQKIKELRQKNLITNEEYQKAKEEVLKKLTE